MKRIVWLILCILAVIPVSAQRVTLKADNVPAATAFRSLMEQSGKNFVYSSDLLKGLRVTIDVRNKPLNKVLKHMFRGTDIEFSIKGRQIILKRRPRPKTPPRRREVPRQAPKSVLSIPDSVHIQELPEVEVISRLEESPLESVEIGARKLSAEDILNTPTLLGEADVVKALQAQPGVVSGTDGFAGMYVHGGNTDENMYMLDNVPLYQVNHFAGLFSAFNTEAIRYIDFFKSSIPARYDGRLASFLDVRTKNGSHDGHHGTARLGLTSGAFNIDGPIGKRTSYSVAMRRSWYDVLTAPALAIINADNDDEKIGLRYYFMDLNGKLTHRFSDRTTAFVSVYFGNDYLKSFWHDKEQPECGWYSEDEYIFRWGNIVAQAGLNQRFSDALSAEFTGAYTRFFTSMKRDERDEERTPSQVTTTRIYAKTTNHIDDWIARADFTWNPVESMRVRFGAAGILHSFLPARTIRRYTFDTTVAGRRDSTSDYHAGQGELYMEDDWRVSDLWRINVGLHCSLFHIDGRTHTNLSPRLSLAWRLAGKWSVKAAYTRTVQYVHQLNETYLSLPVDQWVPITGDFKPQTADKVSFGGYWEPWEGWSFSVEGYYKWMHHLLDYRDEYYLRPPLEMWNARLCQGSGTAKGLDFKVEKTVGRVTGHIAYSLAWTDRTFADKNQGRTFPARFDNRHTINVGISWQVGDHVTLNAAWTGHSGNRFTLLTQMWEGPDVGPGIYGDEGALRAPLNNYQLPFYHRLDLGVNVGNRHGYWTFGLYNAYCHMNTVAIRRHYKEIHTDFSTVWQYKPVFQKVKLLPVIPSVSYTWIF